MYALTIAPLRCDTSVNLGMKQATYFLLFEKNNELGVFLTVLQIFKIQIKWMMSTPRTKMETRFS